jgi:hypothetical protein
MRTHQAELSELRPRTNANVNSFDPRVAPVSTRGNAIDSALTRFVATLVVAALSSVIIFLLL